MLFQKYSVCAAEINALNAPAGEGRSISRFAIMLNICHIPSHINAVMMYFNAFFIAEFHSLKNMGCKNVFYSPQFKLIITE